MPMSPPIACNTPGCGGKRTAGTCDRCGPRKRAPGQPRNTSALGYGSDWQRFRETFLAFNPLCADCEAAGLVHPATEVHHVVKVKDDPSRRLDADNCLALCESHHSKRTRRGE